LLRTMAIMCLTAPLSVYAKDIDDAKEQIDLPYTNHIVHYADEYQSLEIKNRLITLNYDTMELLDTRELEGSLNHHADPLGKLEKANYMMMVPKGSNFVTIREIKSGKHIKKIRLPFKPRSADAYNEKYNLIVLNSRNRPAAVLIDAAALKIVGKAGFDITCNLMNKSSIDRIYAPYDNFDRNLTCLATDFGGDQISGHPIWLDTTHFVILDRSNRLLHIYAIEKDETQELYPTWKTKLVQTIRTDSSLHQLIPEDKDNPNNTVFYGMTEGNQAQKIIPRIYKFKFDGFKLIETASPKMIVVDDLSEPKTKIIGTMGHNLYITPDKKYLYAPLGGTRTQTQWESNIGKGAIFVVDTTTMEIVKQIPAGNGSGHVAFSKQKKMAVVTNHKDNFVTVIDYNKHQFIKNVPLNFTAENIFNLTQSHMQHISEDGKYYYNFWTDGGVFFRINLESLEVDSSVYTGGTPIQGNFYKKIAMNEDIPEPAIKDGYDEFFSSINLF